jgi:hypothetical protein
MNELDMEHEDLPSETESWPGLLEERMDLLQDGLQPDDLRDTREGVERFPSTLEGQKLRLEEVKPARLGHPVLPILTQYKIYRICPIKTSCPVDG